MKTITINTIKTEDFTRVNNDVYGNPRYVLHYLNIADNYLTACNVASTIGGKKFNNSQFGGGVVFQSYNLKDTIDNIHGAIIECHFGVYASYLLCNFDDSDNDYSKESVKDTVESIKQKYNEEYGYYTVTPLACENYLRGLGGFTHACTDFEIIQLGKTKSIKALRKNASKKACEAYVDRYWQEMGEALYNIVTKVEFVG